MPQTQHNSRATATSHRSRVWTYFTNREGDPDKVKCNLCSAELHNKGRTGVLWEHVKAKHLGTRKQAALTTNTSTSYTSYHTQANMTNTTMINNANTNKKPPNANATINSNSRTSSYLGLCNQQSDAGTGAMDLLHEASMKPNPAVSSMDPRNLISRLNQLSLPVARKLKFWNKKSFQVNQYDPSFKVIYLGNLAIQLWSKEESCLEKPLNTLWNNYLVNMKTEIVMRLTICNSGLKAITRQHGLTQYWSNRLVFCCSHKNYPKVFSWVYRHEGKKMRQELRCHAVFCPSPEKASKMVTMLNQRLACALQEFRREKKARGVSVVVGNDSTAMHMELPRIIPLRRQILAKGSANFRPPLERSKSAPKLFSIAEEDYSSSEDQSQDEDQFQTHNIAQANFESSFDEEDEYYDSKNNINHTSGGPHENDGTSTIDTSDKLKIETMLERRDDSVYSAEDGTTSKEEDEDVMQKLESNSLTTTVNEETSYCSVSTQGDTKLSDHQQQKNQREYEQEVQEKCSPEHWNMSNTPATSISIASLPSITTDVTYSDLLIQNRSLLQSSANNNTNSSTRNKHKMEKTILIRNNLPDEMKDTKPGKSATGGLTNTNGVGGTLDDASSCDIVLSWSNLVIE